MTPSTWMNDLKVTPLKIVLKPVKPWRLSLFAEVGVRGALGLALFNGLCVDRHRACRRCALRSGCLIPNWYDPSRLGGNTPRPFVISVKNDAGSQVSDELVINLTLIGDVPRPSALFEAIFRMGRRGLGPQRVPHQVRSISLELSDRSETLFLNGVQTRPWPGESTLSEACVLPQEPMGSLKIFLMHPIHLNHSAPCPEPADLIMAAIGRVRAVARAQSVTLDHRWPDPHTLGGEWRHLHKVVGASRRASKGGYQPLEGWCGSLTLKQELGAVSELFAAAKVLHLGQGSSAGLGQLSLSWRE